jgi:hypothetical protein
MEVFEQAELGETFKSQWLRTWPEERMSIRVRWQGAADTQPRFLALPGGEDEGGQQGSRPEERRTESGAAVRARRPRGGRYPGAVVDTGCSRADSA